MTYQPVWRNAGQLTISGHTFSYAFLSVLAMWHTSMVLLRKEVAVWFGADPGSAAMPYHPTSS